MGLSSRLRRVALTAFLLFLTGWAARPGIAVAAQLALSELASATRLGMLARDSEWVRIALETQQGRALSRALSLPSVNAGALVERLARPDAEPLRLALESRLVEIDARVNELDAHRRSVGAAELTLDERRFFIELLTRRTMTLARPHEVTELFAANRPNFQVARPESGSAATAKQFFVDRDASPGRYSALTRPASEVEAEQTAGNVDSCESSPGVSKGLREKLIDWLDEMKACRLRQPPPKAEASASKWRYFLTGLAVNEAIIAGTYVIGMGEEDVNIEELSTDMLVAAVYMAAGASVLRPNVPFRLQWFRVTTAIATQDLVDSTIYLISPMHRLRSGGEGAHSLIEGAERLALNWSYTWTVSGIAEAGLYEIVSGLECLYPDAKWMSWAPGALRFAQASVAGLIYYSYRHAVIGH